MYVPQVKPQENGSRQDVRWVRLFNNKGIGLKVSSQTPFGMNASYYSQNDLASVDYHYELPAKGDITLCIDAKQRGLGNASCGPSVLNKYECYGNEDYNLTITLAFDSVQVTDIKDNSSNNQKEKLLCKAINSHFSPTVKFDLTIPATSHLSISIYDVMGRMIKQVFNDHINKGRHTILWNKTNDEGHRVSSGVFFYRVLIRGEQKVDIVRRLSIVR